MSKTTGVLVSVVAVGVAMAVLVNGKVENFRRESQGDTQAVLSELKQIQTADKSEEMFEELKQIRIVLEQQGDTLRRMATGGSPQAKEIILPMRESYELGRPDAPLTLVEFIDYQCQFCKQFYDQAFDRLKAQYIDTGRVRYISRDLPLPFHEAARRAAQAVRCAGEQNQFWLMRRILISNQGDLSPEGIRNHAQTLSLDMRQFKKCVAGDRYLAEIQQDIDDARAIGITGTPTFVLGTKSGSRIRGVKIVGAQPYSTFEAKINELLVAE